MIAYCPSGGPGHSIQVVGHRKRETSPILAVVFKLQRMQNRIKQIPQKHYFTNVLATFLDLGTLKLHYCLQRVKESKINILICVPKRNKGIMGLEQHEGE